MISRGTKYPITRTLALCAPYIYIGSVKGSWIYDFMEHGKASTNLLNLLDYVQNIYDTISGKSKSRSRTIIRLGTAFDLVNHKFLEKKLPSLGNRSIQTYWIMSYLMLYFHRFSQVLFPYNVLDNCLRVAMISVLLFLRWIFPLFNRSI